MENIFEKENVSFHGIRGYDFTKFKLIMEMGLLPQKMLAEENLNSNLGEHYADKVFMTISPNILGMNKSRAYNWYVKNTVGIVVDIALENALENRSFPDSGYLIGPILSELFVAITIPKETYESSVGKLRKTEGIKFNVEEEFDSDNILVSDIVDAYNIKGLPVYDSKTGNLLKSYKLEGQSSKQR